MRGGCLRKLALRCVTTGTRLLERFGADAGIIRERTEKDLLNFQDSDRKEYRRLIDEDS